MKNLSRGTPLTVSVESTDKPARLLLWLSSGLALACYLMVFVGLVTPLNTSNMQGGLEAMLLVAVTLATLAALAREIPTQNVVIAGVVIALIGGVVHTVGAYTSMPFGPFIYMENIGPRFQKVLAWPMPLIWIVVILNSRGVARLILRPWRKLKNYGLWLICLTVALVVILDLLFEPFASLVRRYWVWEQTKLPINWQGVPVTNFLGWIIGSILMLAFVTPAVVKKRASSGKSKPMYHALIVWSLAVVLLTVTAFVHQMWVVGVVGAGALVVVGAAALRGARW